MTWTWRHKVAATTHRWFLATSAVGVATALPSAITGVIFFNLFTPGSVVANLVLIPVSSMVILAGFYSLLLGLVGLGAISVVFNHAGALVLLAMERSIAFFLRVPGVFWEARFREAWIGNAVLAATLLAIVFGYSRGWSRHAGGYWMPFVLTALVIACGVRF